MTRKRYIKLLMGHGISRNKAREFAREVIRANMFKTETNAIRKYLGINARLNMRSYEDEFDKMAFYLHINTRGELMWHS